MKPATRAAQRPAPAGELVYDASRPAIDAAASAGYLYAPYKADEMHWFCKPSPTHRTHHLHLVPRSSLLWKQRLAFRDALREEAGIAREYAELKLQLAERFRFDREAYMRAKGPFVRRVLDHRPDGSDTCPGSRGG